MSLPKRPLPPGMAVEEVAASVGTRWVVYRDGIAIGAYRNEHSARSMAFKAAATEMAEAS